MSLLTLAPPKKCSEYKKKHISLPLVNSSEEAQDRLVDCFVTWCDSTH